MRKQTTMRIVRMTLLGLAGLGAAGSLSALLLAGGQATGKTPHQMPMPSTGMMTKDQKIANAMTAAPALGVREGDDPRLACEGGRSAGRPPRGQQRLALPARHAGITRQRSDVRRSIVDAMDRRLYGPHRRHRSRASGSGT